MKKILIISMNHVCCDARLYYKIVRSLQKKDAHIVLANNSNELHDYAVTDIQSKVSHSRSKISTFVNFFIKAFKFKPDIVISVEPLTLIAGYLLKKILKCRFVYDNHEFYSEAFKDKLIELSYGNFIATYLSKLYSRYEIYFASKTDAIISVNDHLVNQLKQANPNTYLCANYLNNDLLDMHMNENYDNKVYDLIYIGSIAFERGLMIYLKTARLFKENNKNYKFLIIGKFKDISTESYFLNYIKQYKLENFIIYKEYMLHEQVLNYIDKSKLGVYMGNAIQCPKYHKTINMKIFEYFSKAVPVIVNNLSMLSDLVNKSQSGWVVNYCSKELYNIAVKLLNDNELIKEKGVLAYNFAKDKCIWELQEQDLYKAVFGE